MSDKISVEALKAKRKQERWAEPITVRFEQNKLIDAEVEAFAKELETAMQGSLLEALRNSDGKIPYTPEATELCQRLFTEAYNSLCKKYNIESYTISIASKLID